jgi:hypothetical protein
MVYQQIKGRMGYEILNGISAGKRENGLLDSEWYISR